MLWISLSNDAYPVGSIKQLAEQQGYETQSIGGCLTIYFDTQEQRTAFSDQHITNPWETAE